MINARDITTPGAAIKAQAEAQGRRAAAVEKQARDPLGARWHELEADELDAAALVALDPGATTLEVGRGGELAIIPPEGASGDQHEHFLADTVRQSPDMLSATASLKRLELAGAADVLELAVDAAETAGAASSLDKMLLHQIAALHAACLQNIETANKFRKVANDEGRYEPQRARANIEAVRSANVAARLSEAFQGGMLTLAKLRNGGKQVVVVTHQHVNVADGGQALVAGAVSGRGAGTN